LAVYAAFNGVDVNAVKPKQHKSKINQVLIVDEIPDGFVKESLVAKEGNIYMDSFQNSVAS
jgi:hypothetical protein